MKRIAILAVLALAVAGCETTYRTIISSEVIKEKACEHGLGWGKCKDKHKVNGDSIVVDSLE